MGVDWFNLGTVDMDTPMNGTDDDTWSSSTVGVDCCSSVGGLGVWW